jgi:YegS/Rv2252/BmrU family lipid kinase
MNLTNCLLLINPISGGGKALANREKVSTTLQSTGYQVRTVVSTNQEDLVAQVLTAPEQLIILLSGDGSLRAAAQTIISSSIPKIIAPLPGGRGNDFCAALGVPRNLNLAVRNLIDTPKSEQVDVMQINQSQIALGAVSIGLDAAAAYISYQIQEQGNRWLTGAPLYLYSALKALRGWQTLEVQLEHSDNTVESKGVWLYVVSNSGRFGGGMKISPNSNLTDGKLEIISVGEVTKFDFLKTLPRVFSGSHLSHPKVFTNSITSIKIMTSKPVTAFADGEPIAATPIEVKVLPKALTVLI